MRGKATAAILLAALGIGGTSVPGGAAMAAASESVVWTFDGYDGAGPQSDPAIDSKGNIYIVLIYGGNYGYGSVVELSPPVTGQTAWTEQLLYSFTGGSDGAYPLTNVTLDSSGNVYGTSRYGGSGYGTNGNGLVFELVKPAAGSTTWTESILHSFTGGKADGANPTGGVVFNAKKELFGTTYNGGAEGLGTIFKLQPPAAGKTAWTESVLHSLAGGTDGAIAYGGLLVDSSGNLYGMTSGGGQGFGTIYELAAPAAGKTAYTESVLFKFDGADGAYPQNSLVIDSTGNLYGTVVNGGLGCSPFDCGAVFKLAPPASGKTVWTETVLHNFVSGSKDGGYPSGALALGAGGVLYGTTQQGGPDNAGTLFELTPPAAGATVWKETILHSFTNAPDGAAPSGGLVVKSGALYGATSGGGSNNDGVVFKLIP